MGAQTRWIGGLNPVETAIAGGAGHVRRVWADRRRDDDRVRHLIDRAERGGIAVERVHARTLDGKLPDIRHQGVAAEIMGRGVLDEDGLAAHLAGLDHAPLVVALDGIQDPHNLGACIRSAEAAGADALVFPRDRAARLTPAVERAAAGAAQLLTLAAVAKLPRVLGQLHEVDCRIVGLAGDADHDLYAADLAGPLVLVLGSEEKGLRPGVRQRCDELVRIPLRGRTESLNVSVATGVCLFEAVRQRR